MPPVSARAQALASRTRHIRCAWCNKPITTMHKAVRYCVGTTCQQEAKAHRQWVRRMALKGVGGRKGVSAAEQAKSLTLEAPARGRRRTP